MTRCLSRREMLAATGALALLVACGGGERAPAGPKPIAIGIDECAWCRMLIDEERLAAQFVADDGRASSFGEVGCLVAWMAAHPDSAGTPFVRTVDAADWRPAAAARYATGAERTPMRFDVTAHAAPPPAGEGVLAETWEELRRKGAPHARQG
jgi:copper chaperone NosL